jgi:hypothetical protein
MIFDLLFRRLTPLICMGGVALIFGLRAFHFDRARRQVFAAYTRMKNADELDVVASPSLPEPVLAAT